MRGVIHFSGGGASAVDGHRIIIFIHGVREIGTRDYVSILACNGLRPKY